MVSVSYYYIPGIVQVFWEPMGKNFILNGSSSLLLVRYWKHIHSWWGLMDLEYCQIDPIKMSILSTKKWSAWYQSLLHGHRRVHRYAYICMPLLAYKLVIKIKISTSGYWIWHVQTFALFFSKISIFCQNYSWDYFSSFCDSTWEVEELDFQFHDTGGIFQLRMN